LKFPGYPAVSHHENFMAEGRLTVVPGGIRGGFPPVSLHCPPGCSQAVRDHISLGIVTCLFFVSKYLRRGFHSD
jgi:hypothetical protein